MIDVLSLAIMCIVGSLICAVIALANLSELGKDQKYLVYYFRRPFDSKEYYTKRGWQFAKLAYILWFLFLILALIDYIIKN